MQANKNSPISCVVCLHPHHFTHVHFLLVTVCITIFIGRCQISQQRGAKRTMLSYPINDKSLSEIRQRKWLSVDLFRLVVRHAKCMSLVYCRRFNLHHQLHFELVRFDQTFSVGRDVFRCCIQPFHMPVSLLSIGRIKKNEA